MGIERGLLGWKHLRGSSALSSLQGAKSPHFPEPGGNWGTLMDNPGEQQPGKGAPGAQRGIHEEASGDVVTAGEMPTGSRGRQERCEGGKGLPELCSAALDTSQFQFRAGDRDLQAKLQGDKCPRALELPVTPWPPVRAAQVLCWPQALPHGRAGRGRLLRRSWAALPRHWTLRHPGPPRTARS